MGDEELIYEIQQLRIQNDDLKREVSELRRIIEDIIIWSRGNETYREKTPEARENK